MRLMTHTTIEDGYETEDLVGNGRPSVAALVGIADDGDDVPRMKMAGGADDGAMSMHTSVTGRLPPGRTRNSVRNRRQNALGLKAAAVVLRGWGSAAFFLILHPDHLPCSVVEW